MRAHATILFLLLLAAAAPPAARAAGDSIDLRVDKVSGGSGVRLSWSDGDPEFRVHRASSPEEVVQPANRIATLRDASFEDTPPAGSLWFYRVDNRANCFRPVIDATVSSAAPSTNFGSDPTLVVSEKSGSRRAYLEFDLGAIPPGADVQSAELQLYLQSSSEPGVETAALDVIETWSEPEITWNGRADIGGEWSEPSHDGFEGWKTWDVASLVRSWVDGSRVNHGFRIDGTSTLTDATYASSEGPDANLEPRLCVTWTDPRDDALERLRADAVGETEVRFRAGHPFFLRTERPLGAGWGGDPVRQALHFLSEYRELFGLRDPQAQLYLDQVKHRGGGEQTTHVFLSQRHASLPVYGAQLVVHLRDEQAVTGVQGLWFPDLPVHAPPVLSARDAEQTALETLPSGDRDLIGDAELLYWSPALHPGLRADDFRLVWAVPSEGVDNESRERVEWVSYVDAHDGTVHEILQVDESNHGHYPDDEERLNVFDVNNTNHAFCWALTGPNTKVEWYDEHGTVDYPDSGDPNGDGPTANNQAHGVYHYYRDTHRRNGWNDDGGRVKSWLYVNFASPNATASRCGLRFSQGYPVDDVYMHEFTHRVIKHEGPLVYKDEQGALNESFADVFGELFEGNDGEWLMGDGLPGGAIRDIQNPTRFSQPDDYDNVCDDAADTNDDCCGALNSPDPPNPDRGCVHINSGITNKAAFLIINGGTHNKINVSGIGFDRAERIYYRALSENILKGSELIDGAYAVKMAAISLESSDPNDFGPFETCQVINAFHAVNLFDRPDADCDGASDPPSADDDGDGVADVDDNCPIEDNADQDDLDMDGIGDACDVDDDGDGVDDTRDNCPAVANPNQADGDGNGTGDVCQDLDGDGLLDSEDNCPNDANPLQENRDNDFFGDACDTDDDNDGFADGNDNCPLVSNPSQDNSDSDSHGDACDNCRFTFNEDQANTDGDSQGNACDADDDNDGVLDGDDNCPQYGNPDQEDNDQNGIGMYCDVGELRLLDGMREAVELDLFLQLNDPTRPIEIPVFPCRGEEGTCPDWMDDWATRVSIYLDRDFTVMLVDDRGQVHDFGRRDVEGVYRLRFPPRSNYHYLSPARGAIPSTDPMTDEVMERRTYTLQLWADPGSSPGTVQGFVRVDTETP